MSDIVVSVNEQKLKDLLEIYKKNFGGIHWEQEKYKWEAIAEFQDNWDINAEDFEKMFNSATYTANCKMDSGRGSLLDIQNSQPCVKILKLYNYIDSNGNKNADIVKQMFRNLFTNAELKDDLRIGTFINDVDNLWEKLSHKPNDKHDQHYAVTTYLWLKFPDKYFIYKYYVCRDLAIAVDSNYTPYKGPKRNKTFDSIIDSQKFYDKIRSYIMDDPEIDSILQKCDREIKFKNFDGEFAKKDYTKWLNTIVTDFAFYVRKYMEKKEIDNDDDMKIQPKNQILYGPPGTGKTYNAVLKAMNIIAPEKNYSDSNYTEAKAEYDKLTEEGRIQFVTFHQSYSYEDFIEGIKPKIAKNEGGEQTDSGEVEYEVKDGVFKAFCKKASTLILDGKKDFGLNPYATVWKVSLEGTGDNATRRECLDNGHIRIGFDSYGADITDETVFDSAVGGKSVLNAFINKMQTGDIVLSCYGEKIIDAIGIVTGEYEWHDEYKKYKRLRKVEWIVKDVREDIYKLNNNTLLTLASVYKLNIPVNDIIDIANKYNSPIKATKNNLPYVFIIDEINRGNISKIFGELITLIEETKREGKPEETSAILPYSGDSFTVPSNVYIIGTMNTADRSLAVVDTALRRRFTFEEMMPDPDLVDINIKGDNTVISIKELLTVMNERITALYDREHTIGHAYFMGLKDIEKPTINDLGEIFKFKIIPLLQEYFYEDYEKIRLVLGDNQKENDGSLKDDKTNNHEFIKIVEKSTDTLFGDANVLNGEAVRFYEINVNNDYNVFNDTLAYKKLQK